MNETKNTQQEQIGTFIKNLREKRGLTQDEFAKELATSQSAVARMESGGQNFSTELLTKISDVLDHKIICVNDSIDFQVKGGKKLSGTIKTNFSKNGSVGLLCASILNKGTTTLHGIARIEEKNRNVEPTGGNDSPVSRINKKDAKNYLRNCRNLRQSDRRSQGHDRP